MLLVGGSVGGSDGGWVGFGFFAVIHLGMAKSKKKILRTLRSRDAKKEEILQKQDDAMADLLALMGVDSVAVAPGLSSSSTDRAARRASSTDPSGYTKESLLAMRGSLGSISISPDTPIFRIGLDPPQAEAPPLPAPPKPTLLSVRNATLLPSTDGLKSSSASRKQSKRRQQAVLKSKNYLDKVSSASQSIRSKASNSNSNSNNNNSNNNNNSRKRFPRSR